MSVEAALTSFLNGIVPDAAVSPGWYAPGAPDPSVTYNQVDDDISRALSGGNVITGENYFDVHVWSQSYLAAKGLARQISTAFNGLSTYVDDWNGVSLHSARTISLQDQDREEDTNLYHVVVSVILQIKES